MIELFKPQVIEPSDYHEALPNYPNAYVCASISALCYKSSVNAESTDRVYKDRVISTLKQWGWDDEDAEETIVFDSKKIFYGGEDPVSGTQGLIIFYKDVVFIGFRGSEKKINDWRRNFGFPKTKSPYCPGKIHKGFLKAFDAVVPNNEQFNAEFEEILNKIKSKQIWLTGHSLGGALASVAASFLLSKDIDLKGIYTFGTPRVGDKKYRNYLNKNLTYKYWRFLNGNDLVPDLPLTSLVGNTTILPSGFSREGCMLRLTEGEPEILRTVDKDGTRKIWKQYHGINAKDHSMKNYRSRLLKLAIETVNSNDINQNIRPEDLQILLENEVDLSDPEVDAIENNDPEVDEIKNNEPEIDDIEDNLE